MTASHIDPRLTERRNPRTADIDLATPREIVDLLHAEDRFVLDAVATQRDAIARAIELAEQLGAEIGECSLPLSLEYGVACYYLVAPAEASSNLARYDGVRYGLRVDGRDITDLYERTRAAGFGREVKRRVMIGTYVLSAGYYDAYYGQAQKVRTMLAREHAAAFERFDVLLTPTSPTVAFTLGEKLDDPWAMYLNDYCTVPVPLAGLPAISIPNGLSDGLPTGFQLAGPAFSENRILDAAFALETAIGFDGSAGRIR